MAWRTRYPFDWMLQDFEEMLSNFESRFSLMQPGRLLPAGSIADRMLPAIRGEFRVDVREHGDEVVVIADLPGVDKENISLTLINPRTLEIKCEREKETEEKKEGYFVREREYGTMSRLVVLPGDVVDDNSVASFRNGVLELKLRRIFPEKKAKIPIE